MFNLLLSFSLEVTYSLAANELTISGTGIITKEGVRSKGSYNKLKNVIINEGPSEISNSSFYKCSQMVSIKIPASVLKIGFQVFRFCTSLNTIEVSAQNPNYYSDKKYGLTTKDNKKFIRCSKVKNFVLPEGVEEIYGDAFSSNPWFNYGNVVFPSSVSKLSFNAFDSAFFSSISFKSVSKLTTFRGLRYCQVDTLTIPSTVTTISSGATYYGHVKNLIFEENSKLEKLENSAFEMFYIDEITLPDSPHVIGEYAFKESTVQRLTIGFRCSSIASTAFAGCKELSDVKLSGTSEYYLLKDEIFMDKGEKEILFIPPNKVSLTIPGTVAKIGKTALQSSKMLTTLIVDGGSTWSAKNGVLYSHDFLTLIAVCGGVTDLKVESNVKTINSYAASCCISLKTVSFLGNSVTSIGSYAFDSSGINTFSLPNSVTSIGSYAFQHTKNLTTFTVSPDSLLQKINTFCFQTSTLESFYFGKDVNLVHDGAFYHCPNLNAISFHAEIALKYFGQYAFEETALIDVEMPSSILSIPSRCFQNCHQLRKFICKSDSKIESIGEIAFNRCFELSEVVLPDKCSIISIKAFCECYALNIFTHQATTIGNGAFMNCWCLESFNISSSQTTVDPSAFQNCSNLITFSVSSANNALKGVGGYVFNSNETILILFPPGQEMAIIPPKTTVFADNAFAWSPKLKFVAFFSGSNLDKIGTAAFYECQMLKSVQLPSKLTRIEEKSFYGCRSLNSITFPDSLKAIEPEAFIGCNLRIVKYCGNNVIEGHNVFSPKLVISVTDMYKGKTFCSNKVSQKLSVDCELKPEFLPTCHHELIIPRTFSLIALLVIFNAN